MRKFVDHIFSLVCVNLVEKVFCHLLGDFSFAQGFDEVVDEVEDLAVARARVFVTQGEVGTGLNVEVAQGYRCKIECFTPNLLGVSPLGRRYIVFINVFDDFRFLALHPCLGRLNLIPKN